MIKLITSNTRAVIFIIAFFLSTSFSYAQVVSVSPANQNVFIGDTVSVKIVVENVTGLKVYSIVVSYSKEFLRCISVNKLDFLNGQFSTFFFATVDSMNGRVQCDEAILGTASSTGSGGLFEMKFVGRSEGTSPITFASLDLRNLENLQLTYSSQNGLLVVQTPTDVGENNTSPEGFILHQNFPNPFNPETAIKFHLPQSARVILEVYTMLGKRVEALVQSELEAGTHIVNFNAQNLSSGIYIGRITAGKNVQQIKMNLLK